MGIKDVIAGFPVPVDYDTGVRLTEGQQHHLEALNQAAEALHEAMHAAEGSTSPGEHQEHIFQTRRMRSAAEHIEVAMMLARRMVVKG